MTREWIWQRTVHNKVSNIGLRYVNTIKPLTCENKGGCECCIK